MRGYRSGSPPLFRPGNPALCVSRPLVTPYYCRLRDLCFVLFVYFFVPSVLWYCWLGLLACKTVSQITYTVLVETLNPAQSISYNCTGFHPHAECCGFRKPNIYAIGDRRTRSALNVPFPLRGRAVGDTRCTDFTSVPLCHWTHAVVCCAATV